MVRCGIWKPVVTFPFLLFLFSGPLRAQKAPQKDASDLIAAAADVMNIKKQGMPAFKMRATLHVLGAGKDVLDGTFELLWSSPSQWREVLQLPGYSRVRVGGDHKIWLQRSVAFEIPRVSQIDDLFSITSGLRNPNQKLGKVQTKKVNGAVRDCVETHIGSASSKRLLCFDQATGALVLEDDLRQDMPAFMEGVEITRTELADFQDWAGRPYPHSMTEFSGSKAIIAFQIDELSPLEMTGAFLFQLPAGAQEWTTCDSPDPAVLLRQDMPKYPATLRQDSIMAAVQIYAEIETDGTLSHLAVVGSARSDMDQAALDAVSKWRYKPMTCNRGTTPRRVYTIISLTMVLN